jgi:hypothetical protein
VTTPCFKNQNRMHRKEKHTWIKTKDRSAGFADYPAFLLQCHGKMFYALGKKIRLLIQRAESQVANGRHSPKAQAKFGRVNELHSVSHF